MYSCKEGAGGVLHAYMLSSGALAAEGVNFWEAGLGSRAASQQEVRTQHGRATVHAAAALFSHRDRLWHVFMS